MKNNPILIFTGLAAAAVIAVAGATKDRWMPGTPETVAEATVSDEQAAVQKPAAEDAPEQNLTATKQATVTEEPATQVVKPSFDTVRVEKGGEALIAGRAEPGSEVTVMLDGKAIGKTTTNTDGAFVLTPDAPLPTGTGALTIESKTSDEAAVQSETSVAVVVPAEEKKEVLVAVVSPDEPTKVLQKETAAATESATSETSATAEAAGTTEIATATPLSLDAVDYDESGNIVFSGSGQPGSTVRVYVDNAVAGEAKAGGDGRWTFSGSSPITVGNHTLRADGIDASGSVSSRVELPFYREEPSKVASAAEQTETAATTTTTSVTADSATETASSETSAAGSATTEVAVTGTTTETASGTSQTATTETSTAESTTATAATETTQAETSTAETAESATATELASDATAAADTTANQTLASAATAETEIAKPKDGRIVIQPGNNLWRISRVIYGSGTKYTVIFESNKDQIRNPHLIFPGQVFMTPDVVPPEKIDPARRDSLKPEEGGSSG